MEEFRFFFHDGAQVETWVNKIGVTDDKLVQIARLRRAWTAVSLFYQTAEQDRPKVSNTDLDSMLDESELRDSKTAFWHSFIIFRMLVQSYLDRIRTSDNSSRLEKCEECHPGRGIDLVGKWLVIWVKPCSIRLVVEVRAVVVVSCCLRFFRYSLQACQHCTQSVKLGRGVCVQGVLGILSAEWPRAGLCLQLLLKPA